MKGRAIKALLGVQDALEVRLVRFDREIQGEWDARIMVGGVDEPELRVSAEFGECEVWATRAIRGHGSSSVEVDGLLQDDPGIGLSVSTQVDFDDMEIELSLKIVVRWTDSDGKRHKLVLRGEEIEVGFGDWVKRLQDIT